MIFLYPLLALVSFLFTLLTYVLAPLLAMTADAGGNLPVCLRWFQTFDATLDEGRNYGYTGSAWWVRTRWLWRNPGYGLDLFLGANYDPREWHVLHHTDQSFVAVGPKLRFEIQAPHCKLGWKASHNLNSAPTTPYWTRIPLVFSIKK